MPGEQQSGQRDGWNADQYERFKDERRQPFDDLVGGLATLAGGRALDLGCGPGTLTLDLSDRLGATDVVGVDNSLAMLEAARKRARPGVRFLEGDLASYQPEAPVDLVLANASLQWVPRHAEVLAGWVSFLKPGGQLAVQVPTNADHPSHTVAVEVAAEARFADWWGSEGPPADTVSQNVLPPERYAEILYKLGLVDLRVQLRVYPHVLPSAEGVVEWVKGTALTRFQARLSPERYAGLLAAYRERLLARLGQEQPFFYPFKRILMWARRP